MSVNTTLLCGGANMSNDQSATIAYSTDNGNTWTPSTNAASIFGYIVCGIANNSNCWVAGGVTAGIPDAVSLGYSFDGDTWIASSSGNEIFDNYVFGIEYANGKFVAIGSGSTYSVAYSYDGITWTGCIPTSLIESKGLILTFISFINGYWIVIGSAADTATYKNTIFYSTDGVSWSSVNSPLNIAMSSIIYTGTKWIANGLGVRDSDSAYYSLTYTSISPGLWTETNWTPITSLFGITPPTLHNTFRDYNNILGLYINNDNSNNIIVVGSHDISANGTTTSTPIILKSEDGINWTSNDNVGNLTNLQYKLIYNNGKWFIGQNNGVSNTTQSFVYSTNAGLTWNTVASDPFGTDPTSCCRVIAQKSMPEPTAPVITSVNSTYSSIAIYFTPPTYNGSGASTIVGYKYTLNGGVTYSQTISTTTSPLVIKIPYVYKDTSYNVGIAAVNSYGVVSLASNMRSTTILKYPCFKSGTKILTNRGYKRIETLRAGDLVKTALHGYIPVWKIGKRKIYHPSTNERIPDQLYVCSSDVYPEVFEDLVITGCHSILVKKWASEEEKERTAHANGGELYITDYHYRLPACADLRAHVYDEEGDYTIYHLALENDDYYKNYGIYANGLLVESCSKRYLTELSGMEIV
jgi:hypothetical protein